MQFEATPLKRNNQRYLAFVKKSKVPFKNQTYWYFLPFYKIKEKNGDYRYDVL